MYKCNMCGHTQEEAGEHCGQPMVAVEKDSSESSAPAESSDGGQQ